MANEPEETPTPSNEPEETPTPSNEPKETPTGSNPAQDPQGPSNTDDNDNLKKLLDDLKTNFTAKLEAQATKYEKQIKERDEYIKTLLTAPATSTASSVADRINNKRDFKKW